MQSPGENRKGTYRSMTAGEIGATVQQLRERLQWSRQTLAESAGLREHTIERVESCARVDQDSLSKIARAFGLPDDTFVRETVYLASDEEQYHEYESTWQDTVAKEARQMTSLDDCDAVLAVRAYAFDPQNTPVELQACALAVIDTVKERTRDYLLRSQDEKHEDCQTLLWAVRQLGAKGWCAQYVVSTTDDQVSLAVVRFLPVTNVDSKGAEPISVPRKFKRMLEAIRKNE